MSDERIERELPMRVQIAMRLLAHYEILLQTPAGSTWTAKCAYLNAVEVCDAYVCGDKLPDGSKAMRQHESERNGEPGPVAQKE